MGVRFLHLLTFSVALALALASSRLHGQTRVYFGTYTDGTSKGIYVSGLDTASGRLTEPELAVEAVNPSFLAVHPSGRFLYAVNEVEEHEERPRASRALSRSTARPAVSGS